MNSLVPMLKFARSAILALAVGSLAFAAVPAQAQPYDGSRYQDGQRYPDRPRFDDGPRYRPFPNSPGYGRVCLPEWQLRRILNNSGYRNISFFSFGNVRVQARAVRGPWVYRLTVNRCTGNIINAVRVGRR